MEEASHHIQGSGALFVKQIPIQQADAIIKIKTVTDLPIIVKATMFPRKMMIKYFSK